jgi:uridine phosphorylase
MAHYRIASLLRRFIAMNNRLDPVGDNNRQPAARYAKSDLPIEEDGRIYHLQVKPEQIAPDILLVGDPGRAEFIGSTYLSDIEVEHEHRGLVTITGTADILGSQATIISPLRTTVTTSGMGTGSLEIVVGELVALNEIDFATRTPKSEFPRLHIIRVGSSGALQASTKLCTPIITSYAIGLENTGFFYDSPPLDQTCTRLESELGRIIDDSMSTSSRFYGKIHPYVTRAEPALVNALVEASKELGIPTKVGLSVSAPGFFAPQGREIARVKASVPELDKLLGEYDPKLGDQRVENMEMESSFLIHFLSGLGYWAGAICPAISNRRENTFDLNNQQAMKNATEVALLALATLRNRYPDTRISRVHRSQ